MERVTLKCSPLSSDLAGASYLVCKEYIGKVNFSPEPAIAVSYPATINNKKGGAIYLRKLRACG